jgi:hypothetical protein
MKIVYSANIFWDETYRPTSFYYYSYYIDLREEGKTKKGRFSFPFNYANIKDIHFPRPRET